MPSKPLEPGPRLEALLDERRHLRVKINLAENDADTLPEELKALRSRLFEPNRDILKQWGHKPPRVVVWTSIPREIIGDPFDRHRPR
jgi:hypothetical protein